MKIAFYSYAFYTGGMENAVYHLCRKLKQVGDYDITICFEFESLTTKKMISKLSEVAKIVNITNNVVECDLLINCDRGKFDLPNIKAKHTIHWFSSCLIKNIPDLRGEVVSQSKWHYDKLKKLGIESTIIGNPLDVDYIIEKSLVPINNLHRKDELIYMVVSRISGEKGFDRIAQYVIDRFGKNMSLVVVGDITNQSNQPIKDQLKRKLRSKVSMLGEIDNPYPYMRQADFILCLSDNEIYGLVSEEAHILGKQVIFNKYPTAYDQFIKGFDFWLNDKEQVKSSSLANVEMFYRQNDERLKKWKELIDKYA